MSLAQDLLRRAGIIESPPRPVLVRREPVKKPVITPEPTPAAPVKRAGKYPTCGLHLARVPGIARTDGGWRPYVTCGRVPMTLGAFDTLHRAMLARKLYFHWLSKGYGRNEIPRMPRLIHKR